MMGFVSFALGVPNWFLFLLVNVAVVLFGVALVLEWIKGKNAGLLAPEPPGVKKDCGGKKG